MSMAGSWHMRTLPILTAMWWRYSMGQANCR